MRIFVAIPIYDSLLQIRTVKCLLEEQALAGVSGDEISFVFLPSCSVPAAGRNQLVQDFMDSECDRLIFLDSDITFEPGYLLKLAHHPVDFVGGCYRYKLDQESYPLTWLNKDELWSDANGLIEVETLPNGFLALSRNVFEKLKLSHPEREYEHFGKKAFCYFQMIFQDGQLHSEDSYFCKEWRAIGGQVFLDPEIELTHWAWNFSKPYVGHLGEWLRTKLKEV